MATIGKLVVSLSANSAKLVSELGKTRKSVKKWGADIAKTVAKAGAVFAGLALIIGGAVLVAINRNAAAIDDMTKAAGKLNFPIEDFQKFAYVAGLSNISMDKFGVSMQKMQKTIGDARAGLSTASDAFDQLGLSADSLAKMSPSKQFELIAERMKDIPLQADKIKIAMDIFGRSGADLLNVFAGDVKAAGDEFDSLGVTITENQAMMVAAYQDSKTKLSTLLGGFGTQLTAEVAPAFTFIVEKITETIMAMGGIKNAANKFALFIVQAIEVAAVSVVKLMSLFKSLQVQWLNMKGLWLLLNEPISELVDGSNSKINELMNTRSKLVQEIASGEDESLMAVRAMAKTLKDKIEEGTSIINEAGSGEASKLTIKGEDGTIDYIASAKARIAAEQGLTKETDKTSAALALLTESAKGAAVAAEKGKVSDQFKQYAEMAKKDIVSGSMFTGEKIKVLQNLSGAAVQNGALPQDIVAMQQVISQLQALSTASEEATKAVQQARGSAQPPSLGSLLIDMTTDTGRVAGEIFGEPKFMADLKAFVTNYTNERTRQAAQ